MKEIAFENLDNADLVIECIYKGGTDPNLSSEPLHKLIPKCGNSGGFRATKRVDGSNKYAYVVLYTSMEELEWPDYLDKETGLFRYYGDNRTPGRALIDTGKKGNRILEQVFETLNIGQDLEDIPPFFIFRKTGNGRDMQFLGLAAPGNPKLSSDKDLVAFWRTMNGNRFQNYEAYFTVIDTGKEPIQRKWIDSLIYDHDNNLDYAPENWIKFIKEGRNGIVALKAPKIHTIPSKYEQLQTDEEGKKCIEKIRERYKDNPYAFEKCAQNILEKMDPNFVDFELTRPWRDGGRDALGYYSINPGGKANYPLKIDCAMEAKCYAENTSVGVKQMSRLISRIRYRQFGVLITTSYVHSQAYEEVVEDGHPILIVTASNIASILRANGIDSTNVDAWLDSVDGVMARAAYYHNKMLEKNQNENN